MLALRNSRSPLADLQVASSSLNRLFDEARRGWPEAGNQLTGTWMPPVDVFENTNEVRIVAEMPGVRPDDIRISVENNVITIRGEKQPTQDAEGKESDRVHRSERVYGLFERSFTMPTTVDAEKIVARYEQGVLTLVLPKAERAKPRQISVQVQA
jgi:HSP20 family protein